MVKRIKTTSRDVGDDPLKWNKEDTATTAAPEAPDPGSLAPAEITDPVVTAIEGNGPIVLDAVLTIAEAAVLKDQLLPHVNRKGEISVDGSRVESVDTAGLQVLLAFVRTLQKHGAVVRWTGVSKPLLSTARLLGVAGHIGLQT